VRPADALPLAGWRVIVTRGLSQASSLTARLVEAGAQVVEFPVIAIADASDGGAAMSRALSRIEDYEWVVFTSANTVDRCWRHLSASSGLGRAKVAAIGKGTAEALAQRGVIADLLPDRFVAESLVEVFPTPARAGEPSGLPILLPCAEGAREVLAKGLRAKGWRVDVVEAYRTVRPAADAASATALTGADAVTFTSASTVTGYLELAGAERVPPVVACIGPVTADTARQAGLEVDVVAPIHTVEGLVDALAEWARHKGAPDGRR